MPSPQSLFSTVPNKKVMPFYNPNGVLETKKVINYFAFSNPDVAVISNVSSKSVRFDGDRTPELVKQRFSEIANICELVANQFDGDLDKTHWWFTTENPLLGGVSPRQMIKAGNYDRLKKIVQEFIAGDVG